MGPEPMVGMTYRPRPVPVDPRPVQRVAAEHIVHRLDRSVPKFPVAGIVERRPQDHGAAEQGAVRPPFVARARERKSVSLRIGLSAVGARGGDDIGANGRALRFQQGGPDRGQGQGAKPCGRSPAQIAGGAGAGLRSPEIEWRGPERRQIGRVRRGREQLRPRPVELVGQIRVAIGASSGEGLRRPDIAVPQGGPEGALGSDQTGSGEVRIDRLPHPGALGSDGGQV